MREDAEMILGMPIEQTTERYESRSAQRERTATVVAVSPLEADSPERVTKRMNRIAAAEAARPAPAASTAMALERILGRSDLMSVNYLEIGLRAARCVGRVTIRQRNGTVLGYGSGFTISPRLFITNHHVLGEAAVAATSRVEFNYQEDAGGRLLASVSVGLEPDAFFLTDPGLDFTIVALAEQSIDGTKLGDFFWLPLIEEEGKVLCEEYVNIIQHPNGEPKQLALRENKITEMFPNFIQYKTDTAPGSSGSPVFNDQWEVVALHHSGVPERDGQGRMLTRDGTVWTEEMGEHRIAWKANEGVRVSRIVGAIRAARLGPDQDRLRQPILDGKEPGSPSAPPADGPGSDREVRSGPGPKDPASTPLQAAVSEDGTATWTIPLQVSVRLGTGGMPAQARGGDGAATAQPLPPRPAALPVPDAADGAPAAAPSPELQEALREVERARGRTYYDAAQDAARREAYYDEVDAHVSPGTLYRQLSRLVDATHRTRLPYKPMTHLYPWVDLHPDLKLRSIYSGKPFEAEELIREDARVAAERSRMVERMRTVLAAAALPSEQMEATLDTLEASLPYNCEHVVPQSWFGKAEPMRGDLHHLFACESGCNSFRGNIPYFDFPDFEEAVRGECGKREQGGFEPANGKGAVARATLYFLLRYPGEIDGTPKEYRPESIRTLLAWHAAKPPSPYERHRNAAIEEMQGNRNPLIDHPEWASRIDFAAGLG
ncbi:hypothetical protein VQ02_27320 [Methylobacterium variabile]|uniref:Serine protease n=2 Tax=Methylobacterium variabile TaxID=298794 RepID=A0A0J6SAS2_9HYPH|nr:hypothetical protein VQ02_27320 [Methylobacterium variabile]